MTALLTTARLAVSGGSADWSFAYRDGHGGVVATAAPVTAEQPPHGWRGWFSTDHNLGRVVVRVDDPAGTPLFFADRQPVPPSTGATPPCAILAPHGGLLGRVAVDTARRHRAHRILGADDTVLFEVVWEPSGRYGDFTAPDGSVAARYHPAQGLWFQRRLPSAEHTLVVAFPVALALLGTTGT
ncbi:hypothetical protein [Stackebrandtia nassauensis]|uniref:Uncharacterized protein n=1 Tax=Stackebrandtia nassauensis (strain DSM 44728 / CIP 108903 / NRRL B-16338 / NBRC 102104 / LLR-40K-21) TaxID=446470 RepID=D3QBF1_STANL|nr:hypothetical protein [Stackebrandtia nassauensis]ADD42833.1 hypothetical protein Snas_3162 [Stackebrandtia nassauensis DSM 44728]